MIWGTVRWAIMLLVLDASSSKGGLEEENPWIQESLNVLFDWLIDCLLVGLWEWKFSTAFCSKSVHSMRERERENVDLRWFWWWLGAGQLLWIRQLKQAWSMRVRVSSTWKKLNQMAQFTW
jgi:hypothetical protein